MPKPLKCKNNHLLKTPLQPTPPPPQLHPVPQLPADFTIDVPFSSMLPSPDLQLKIVLKKNLKPEFKPLALTPPFPATDQSQQQSSNIQSCITAQELGIKKNPEKNHHIRATDSVRDQPGDHDAHKERGGENKNNNNNENVSMI